MKEKTQLVRLLLLVFYFVILIGADVILAIHQDEELIGQLAFSASAASFFFAFSDFFSALASPFYRNDKMCNEFNAISKRFLDNSNETMKKADFLFEKLVSLENDEENRRRPLADENYKKLCDYKKKLGKIYKRSSGETSTDEVVPRSIASISDRIMWLNKGSKLLVLLGFFFFVFLFFSRSAPTGIANSSITVAAFAVAILCYTFKNPQDITVFMWMREHYFERITKKERQVCTDVERWLSAITKEKHEDTGASSLSQSETNGN